MPRIFELGDAFYDVVAPAKFPKHALRFRNDRAALGVGLDTLTAEEWTTHFAKFEPLLCNLHEPLALRYHGHQFGVYNPDLGDGRGFLFAQLMEGKRLMDLGTKGSGKTPWSRGADGRLTLKGGVREVLATEMLEALGVPTSRTFSLFETGEPLMRGDEPSPTRSSVLVRLCHSHIRFGTFQRLARLGERAAVQELLEYVARHYMPDLASEADLPTTVLREVTRVSAELCASWMIAGFVHGVLNTDNMNINGESFDYGPYRFLPAFDVDFTAAYFDHTGLYAYGRQANAVLWNVSRLAEALRTVSPDADFIPVLAGFEPHYRRALSERLLARLGLASRGEDEDARLVDLAFVFLDESQVGFDQFFFDWYAGAASAKRAREGPAAAKYEHASFRALEQALGEHAPTNAALLSGQYFQRSEPETLLIDEIESLWLAISAADDWGPFESKLGRIRAMPPLAVAPARD
jgi:uncharacterized protein YdiU (UPF0061 family)